MRPTSCLAILGVSLATACTEMTEPAAQPALPQVLGQAADVTSGGSCGNCLVGPVTLTRGNGEPEVVTFEFEGDPAAGYVLDVADNGSRGLTGAVRLNGEEVVLQNAIGGSAGYRLHRPVPVAASNRLEVRLEGKPGATMTVMLRSGVQTIGSGGGVLRAPGGDLLVEVPPGALSGPVELSIAPLAFPITPEIVSAWELEPTGTTFATPVKLIARIQPAQLAAAGPGALPLIVTAQHAAATDWTIVPEPEFDPAVHLLTVQTDHFSPYAIAHLALNASHIRCAMYFINAGPFFSLPCPPVGQSETVSVAVGGSQQLGLVVDVAYANLVGWSILGVLGACENIIIGHAVCVDVTTGSSNAGVAIRTATGAVIGVSPGTATLNASVKSVFKGATTVNVTWWANTVLFALASSPNAELGGATATLAGGASLTGGRLALNGSSGYLQLNSRIIPASGSFSVTLFARETVSTPTYVEFISQGISGSGFYIGHTPGGNMRVSDAWQDTGIPMPQDPLEHHYAVAYDAANNLTRLYIDAQLSATLSGSPTRGAIGGDNTRLGRQYDPFAEYLAGTIDDVGVHLTALSGSDVQALARRTPDLPCSAEGSARSISGVVASAIAFENQTGESVRVEWLDYGGVRRLPIPVAPGTRYLQQTYQTHPWIVTGMTTGTCYGIWLPVSGGRAVRIS